MTPKIFISYSRLDLSAASELYAGLKEWGLDVWFDEESLLPGQDWEVEIKKAIEESDFVALLLSNNSVARRGYFHKEVKKALDVLQMMPFGHIYLLPVRLDDCKIPPQLAPVQYVDLFPDRYRGLGRLIKAIELQTGIQLSARLAEKEPKETRKAKVLLVNDEPAAMNLVVDLWKSQGLGVDYAFDVPQAIKMIQESPPQIVVSDLSHYSFGKLITDRAGFEILEWLKKSGKDIEVIIATSELTDGRRDEAACLSALGICNNVAVLNALLSQATGVAIKQPEILTAKAEEHSQTGVGLIHDAEVSKLISLVYIIYKQSDQDFAVKLADDLRANGLRVKIDEATDVENCVIWGTPWGPIQSADHVVVVLSKELININSYCYALYKNSYIRPIGYRKFPGKVVPAIIDDVAAEDIALGSERNPIFDDFRQFDFRSNYDSALAELVKTLGQPTY